MEQEEILAPRPNKWKETGEIILKNKLTLIGFIIVGLIVAIGVLSPLIAPYDPNLMNMPERLAAPSGSHLFGTDEMGRDILSRIMYGARISIIVGVVIVVCSAVIGCFLGSLSGYAGGKIDQAVMAVTDMILAFPSMVLALALTAAMGPGLVNTMLAVIIVRIPMYTRLMRGQVLVAKEQQYVRAAKTFGERPFKIVLRHIVPNCLTPLMVQMTLGIGDAILIASSMSFIGLGAQPPTPEWGAMISTARIYAIDQWWYAAFPGLFILITIMGFNLIGDGIRDILDPRSRK